MASDSEKEAADIASSLEVTVPGGGSQDDEDKFWEVLEILQENRNKFKVRWAGTDPATGKPWEDSWIPKSNCNATLIRSWREIKKGNNKSAVRNAAKARPSTTSSRTSKRSTATPSTSTSRSAKPSVVSPENSTAGAPRASSSTIRPRPGPPSEPKPQRTQKRRKSLRHETHSEEEGPEPEPIRPRKKRKVSVEVVVPPIKIGPPRGVKRAVSRGHSSRPYSSRPSVTASGSSANVTDRELPPAPDVDQLEDLAIRDELQDHSGFWDFEFDAPGVSKDAIIPETQTARDRSPPAAESDSPTSPPLRPLRASGSGTVVSRMKARNAKEPGSTSVQNSPLTSGPALRSSRDSYTPEAPRVEGHVVNVVARPKTAKILDLARQVSPSLFKAKYRNQELSQDPIEPWTPQRGVEDTGGLGKLTAQVKGKAVAITMNDDELHARGLELAHIAAARARPRRRSPLYRRSSSSGPHEAQETDQAELGFGVPEQSSLTDPAPATSQPLDDSDVVQEMADAFLNLNGGDDQSSHETPVESQVPSDSKSAGSPLSLGPNIPGKWRRPAPFDSPESSDQEKLPADDLRIPENSPLPVIPELPATSSAQQTDVHSLSQEPSFLETRVRELMLALDEKNASISNTITNLEEKVATLESQLADVQAENAQLNSAFTDLQRKRIDAEHDVQLFRELYGKASAYASEVGKKNDELEEQVRVSSGQAKDGVAMIKAMHEQQLSLSRLELEKLKGLCKILTDKDQRTNDEIRRRAALEPQLHEENNRLKTEIECLKIQFEELQTVVQHYAEAEGEPSVDELDIETANTNLDGLLHVCEYVDETTTCHAVFETDAEVLEHAFTAHYPRLLSLTSS